MPFPTNNSGLIDRDAWIAYLGAKSAVAPIAPDFARRGVQVVGMPGTVDTKGNVSFTLNKLDLTSMGSPANTTATVTFTDSKGKAKVVDTVGVTGGTANVELKLPADARTSGTLSISVAPSGTTVTLPVKILNPNEQCNPNKGAKACR